MPPPEAAGRRLVALATAEQSAAQRSGKQDRNGLESVHRRLLRCRCRLLVSGAAQQLFNCGAGRRPAAGRCAQGGWRRWSSADSGRSRSRKIDASSPTAARGDPLGPATPSAGLAAMVQPPASWADQRQLQRPKLGAGQPIAWPRQARQARHVDVPGPQFSAPAANWISISFSSAKR